MDFFLWHYPYVSPMHFCEFVCFTNMPVLIILKFLIRTMIPPRTPFSVNMLGIIVLKHFERHYYILYNDEVVYSYLHIVYLFLYSFNLIFHMYMHWYLKRLCHVSEQMPYVTPGTSLKIILQNTVFKHTVFTIC